MLLGGIADLYSKYLTDHESILWKIRGVESDFVNTYH